MHIAIAGNIGSGKTTLTKLLSKNFGWEAIYEETESNPYLVSFYEDMERWSFNLQIFFLSSRFRQIMEIKKKEKTVVQDRTIYEDAYIFAANLHDMNLLSTRDFDNYLSVFELMTSFMEGPDLLIYLKASVPTLVANIQKRGRKYEESIRLDYLRSLNDKYNDWISNYNHGKLLVVDVDNIDFENNPEDMASIVEKINAQLHGLF